MKRLLLIAVALQAASNLLAQGTLAFNTIGPGVNAVCTDATTMARVSGTSYFAQLYWAEGVMSDPWQLNSVTNPPAHFGTGVWAGYVTSASGGGNCILPVPGGTPVTVQVRAWDAMLGASWEAAYATWLGGQVISGLGVSDLVVVTPAEVPYPPAGLWGLQPWSLVGPVPEPGLFLSLALGLCAWWLTSRRR